MSKLNVSNAKNISYCLQFLSANLLKSEKDTIKCLEYTKFTICEDSKLSFFISKFQQMSILYFQGRCTRENPKCKYLHPPQHIKDQLLINGRNNLALKNLLSAQLNQSAASTQQLAVNPLLAQMVIHSIIHTIQTILATKLS